LPVSVIVLLLPILKAIIVPALLLVFFLVGAVESGNWIGFMNSLIFISPSENRPIYLGLMNTLLGIVMLSFALLGGVIAQLLPLHILFSLSTISAVAAFVAARKLHSV
ncbi:MAG: hypothetical protein N2234_02215, partial [Planctomycetota bacterium]|nr:hypothetical protein [Planctomycetota bacterium]